jgi:hypothetical protein
LVLDSIGGGMDEAALVGTFADFVRIYLADHLALYG